jgi:hypothetical protein
VAAYGNSLALPNAPCRPCTRARPGCLALGSSGASGWRPAASQTARSARERAFGIMPSRAKRRATPSGFMMNGPTYRFRCQRRAHVGHVHAAPGGAVPLHQPRAWRPTACPAGRRRRGCTGCGGWPARRSPSSASCRGRTGRVVAPGHLLLPACVQAPAVDPVAAGGGAVVAQHGQSSGSCSPALTSTLVGSFGSATSSASALPLISRSSSSGAGWHGWL